MPTAFQGSWSRSRGISYGAMLVVMGMALGDIFCWSGAHTEDDYYAPEPIIWWA